MEGDHPILPPDFWRSVLLTGGLTMLIGYVRVSTNDQNTDLQRNAFICAGSELIVARMGSWPEVVMA